jgi:hypothetical protein
MNFVGSLIGECWKPAKANPRICSFVVSSICGVFWYNLEFVEIELKNAGDKICYFFLWLLFEEIKLKWEILYLSFKVAEF